MEKEKSASLGWNVCARGLFVEKECNSELVDRSPKVVVTNRQYFEYCHKIITMSAVTQDLILFVSKLFKKEP